MFAPYCEAHESRILLPASAITALVSTENGIIARFTCSCGTPGTWRARP